MIAVVSLEGATLRNYHTAPVILVGDESGIRPRWRKQQNAQQAAGSSKGSKGFGGGSRLVRAAAKAVPVLAAVLVAKASLLLGSI